MKTELCSFSGYKIYPGHGRKFVRGDSKSFYFITTKTKVAFMAKSNPRKVAWTQVYRKVHKKGTMAEVQKRKARRKIKIQRDIVGASLDQIRQKKAQRPEIRAAAREAAVREIRERKKKRLELQKKAKKSGAGKGAKRQQQRKQGRGAAKHVTKGR
mmetsp:Transcript_225/g.259  ORF Transcript_225/g.259 Transcript_225/m.259 type:complete len:156 (-) Transcript_225:51-518(-)|eukprot:CAMPEP_0174255506 /NCGR_PEP_ID=MMETSP0439-20130205/4832_1 /TAXON_ID=0 /ORGANISM="Stereomyxa ramosa, Strain Chinc5" /LENGTH=155 /DNA_ID=CAMNT_0015337727 /DNA_START=55 /DNA_END=522 /DNA_ORIENTATION=-